jgi:hypothetical protein
MASWPRFGMSKLCSWSTKGDRPRRTPATGARKLFGTIGNWLGAANCAVEQGWLALEDKDVTAARSHFEFAAPIVTKHPYDRWRAAHGLARCAVVRGALQSAFDHYRAALETVADLRQRLASEEISSRIYVQAALLHADALRLAATHGASELVVEIGEWQRTLAFKRMLATGIELPPAYRAEHDRLRAMINELLSSTADNAEDDAGALDAALSAYGELLLHARHSSGSTYADLEQGPLDLERLRAVLGEAYGREWTALVYIPSDQELLIGIITAEDLVIARAPYDAELEDLIAKAVQPTYRRSVYRDLAYYQGQTATRWEVLREVGERLLPVGVRERLHPEHRLLIVPAGPLHGLPWAALRLDDQWLAARGPADRAFAHDLACAGGAQGAERRRAAGWLQRLWHAGAGFAGRTGRACGDYATLAGSYGPAGRAAGHAHSAAGTFRTWRTGTLRTASPGYPRAYAAAARTRCAHQAAGL